MKKGSQNMYKVGFAGHLLFILHKLDKLDKKLATRIENKAFLLISDEVI